MKIDLIRFRFLASEADSPLTLDIPVAETFGPVAKLCLPKGLQGSIDLWKIDSGYFCSLDPNQIYCSFKGCHGPRNAFKLLVSWLGQGRDAMIPVKSVKDGPSQLSKKVSIDGVIYRWGKRREEYTSETRKSHTLTVPASMVYSRDGEDFIQKGFLMRVIHERILSHGAWPHDVEGGRFLHQDLLWSSLFADLENRIQALEIEAQQKRTVQSKMQQDRQQASSLARESQPTMLTSAELGHLAEQRRLARIAKLPVIQASWVEWKETVSTGSGRYKKFVHQTKRVENCEIRVSGQRLYIKPPNGAEVIKMKKNVRWEESKN